MSSIIVLDKTIANKIAAGEVIENPASIVKELLENSLDAGARTILVDLTGDGTKRIVIADDGHGMSRGDVELAIKRHATSKIKEEKDLYVINTLGFRGEALPSIAAVSKVTIQTRQRGCIEGSELKIEGGRVTGTGPVGCPEGTTVTVEDLFYNTPVRKKYLKKGFVERAKVSQVVAKVALSKPNVRIEYNEDGKRKLTSPGTGNLLGTIDLVLGTQISRELIAVNRKSEPVKISGYLGKPALSRSNRKYQYLFINDRSVKNLNITYAVESAFGELIPRGRYPVYFLSLHLPPGEVDVNVHPAKTEVRIQNEKEFCQVIKNEIRQAILGREAVLHLALSGKRPDHGPASIKSLPDRGKIEFGDAGPPPVHNKTWEKSETYTFVPEREVWLEPLAQIKELYIIAAGPEGLYIIDQHAAHERVLYEQISDKLKREAGRSQMLATPLPLDLSHKQIELLYDHIMTLREIGFILEEFGPQSILIRGVPVTGNKFTPESVILDLLDYIEDKGAGIDKNIIRRELLYSIACKNAIKAGDKLQPGPMQELLEQLLACDNPYSCPHGRPTMLDLTYREINKKLGRGS